MALIYIYDSSELDQRQLEDGLKDSDHRWEYIIESISANNCDPEAEVISVFVTSTVTAEMIEKMPKLKLIACRSTGFNNVDLAAAAARGITVTNVPTYGESTVAEYTFTLLLALMRKLPPSLGFLSREVEISSLMGHDLHEKTIGVVGSGHIGQHVIKIAKGFEMRVVAYDPFAKEELATELGFEYIPLDELLKTSDVVTLHAPLVPENVHLINAERLALMKASAVLINTARGELVDAQALAEALQNDQLAGAALDVLEGEQLFDMHEEVALLRSGKLPTKTAEQSVALLALNKMSNVILTPHNAFNTEEAIGRINSTTCQNIIRFWYGDVPNRVQPQKPRMGKLLVTRHAESEWNALGQWTGLTDVHLSEKGFHEAALLGVSIRSLDIKLDQAYCSEQIRTLETLEGILDASGQIDVPFSRTAAINERDYGEYTGKNKWDMKELVGDDEFSKIRRGWDHPVPGGETLKRVYERVIPFYKDEVLPLLLSGKNVLLVAHGNSIRALMKYIENISDEDVENLEMPFGNTMIYDVDPEGHMLAKNETRIDTVAPNA
ncbi:2,3-bisphosphoglycerate-dependent phosphoglycerate mutase [Candidatus Saccharibacteria bacterium]|nr:MAG: 2,3-bisphosphoglycerate-dependent phosphoglycerate mutase [Candidatus Saccharibacteria bacterium]